MTTNYEKSNHVRTVDIRPTPRTRKLYLRVLRARGAFLRQRLGAELLLELCRSTGITAVELSVTNTKQVHKKTGGRVVYRQYGLYRPDLRSIHITNRTAVRGQELSPKAFLNTLLHEWMHHYDSLKLRLDSIHTAGFYGRIKDLETKLAARPASRAHSALTKWLFRGKL